MLRNYLFQWNHSFNNGIRHTSTDMKNEFIALVNDQHDTFTKLERRIAAYLLATSSPLLVDTSGAIADRAHVSPMPVTRFFKKLGFESAAAAKEVLKKEHYGSEARTIGKRFDEFQRSRAATDHDAHFQSAAAATSRACEISLEPVWRDTIAERAILLLPPARERAGRDGAGVVLAGADRVRHAGRDDRGHRDVGGATGPRLPVEVVAPRHELTTSVARRDRVEVPGVDAGPARQRADLHEVVGVDVACAM